MSTQAGRQEIMSDLKNMVIALLREFYTANRGIKPEAIV